MRGKVGVCFQWKTHEQCSKGDSCSFSHNRLAQGDLCSGQRRKGRSSSPAPNSKAKTDEGWEKSSKQPRGKLYRQKEHNSAPLQKNVETPSCRFEHPPVLSKTTSLRSDAYVEEHVSWGMVRLRSPARSQRKMVRKDQLPYWRSLHNWVVYPKSLIRETLFHVKKENWDQNTRQILQGHLASL